MENRDDTKELVILQPNGTELRYIETEIKRQYAPNATPEEWWLYKMTAQHLGLDPIRKEIYFTKYNTKDGPRTAIITAYQVYLQRVQASGLQESWNVKVVKPNETDVDSWIGIFTGKRSDWEKEFVWEVPMREVNKRQALWNIMPEFQLKKNTISQGLRMLYPEIIGGLIYTAEELTSETSEALIEGNPPYTQTIQPDISEQAKLDQEKLASIEKMRIAINGRKSIAELEKWHESQKAKLETSLIKNEIIEIYQARLIELQIETITKATELDAQDVDNYFNINGCRDMTMLDEALAGNAEAIAGIKKAIVEFNEAYLARQAELNKTDSEEAELDALADERASEA